tara:strand:+ start:271 stop:891 length:621 start_codon:yes stop_codon:yes gene_type:complete
MNKIKILGSIPHNVTLACSGGPDSMAALDFLKRGKKNVSVAHFDHGTDHGVSARSFLEEYCNEHGISISIGSISGTKPREKSWEEWWRDERYGFFRSISGKKITAHNLNDVAEWWIFSSLSGNPNLIPYRNRDVFRPFLTTSKIALEEWCKRKAVPYVKDPGNLDLKYARSRIRNNIFPEVLSINPGLLKVMERKVRKEFLEKTIG